MKRISALLWHLPDQIVHTCSIFIPVYFQVLRSVGNMSQTAETPVDAPAAATEGLAFLFTL